MNNTAKKTPVLSQSYCLRINSKYNLTIDYGQYLDLLNAGIAFEYKDRIIKQGRYTYRLLVLRLIDSLTNICRAYNTQEKKIRIEVLEQYRDYVSPNVARALRSILGAMILRKAHYTV